MKLELDLEDLALFGGVAMKAAEALGAADEETPEMSQPEPTETTEESTCFVSEEMVEMAETIGSLTECLDHEIESRHALSRTVGRLKGDLRDEGGRRAGADRRLEEALYELRENHPLAKAMAALELKIERFDKWLGSKGIDMSRIETLEAGLRQTRRNESTTIQAIGKLGKRVTELREDHPLGPAIERLSVRIMDEQAARMHLGKRIDGIEAYRKEDVSQFVRTRIALLGRLDVLEKENSRIEDKENSRIVGLKNAVNKITRRLDVLEKGAPIREGTQAEHDAIEKQGQGRMDELVKDICERIDAMASAEDAECTRLADRIMELEAEVKRLRGIVSTVPPLPPHTH